VPLQFFALWYSAPDTSSHSWTDGQQADATGPRRITAYQGDGHLELGSGQTNQDGGITSYHIIGAWHDEDISTLLFVSDLIVLVSMWDLHDLEAEAQDRDHHDGTSAMFQEQNSTKNQ
jgi:hypothetical protein